MRSWRNSQWKSSWNLKGWRAHLPARGCKCRVAACAGPKRSKITAVNLRADVFDGRIDRRRMFRGKCVPMRVGGGGRVEVWEVKVGARLFFRSLLFSSPLCRPGMLPTRWLAGSLREKKIDSSFRRSLAENSLSLGNTPREHCRDPSRVSYAFHTRRYVRLPRAILFHSIPVGSGLEREALLITRTSHIHHDKIGKLYY